MPAMAFAVSGLADQDDGQKTAGGTVMVATEVRVQHPTLPVGVRSIVRMWIWPARGGIPAYVRRIYAMPASWEFAVGNFARYGRWDTQYADAARYQCLEPFVEARPR